MPPKEPGGKMGFVTAFPKILARPRPKSSLANSLAKHQFYEPPQEVYQPVSVRNDTTDSTRVKGKANRAKQSAEHFGFKVSTQGKESTVNQMIDFFSKLKKALNPLGDGIKTKKPKIKTKKPKPKTKPKPKPPKKTY